MPTKFLPKFIRSPHFIIILLFTLTLTYQALNFGGYEPHMTERAQAQSWSSFASSESSSKKEQKIEIQEIKKHDKFIEINFEVVSDKEQTPLTVFYIDDFFNLESSYIYSGESPFSLPIKHVPDKSQKVCVSLLNEQMERVSKSESCQKLG